MGSMMAIYGEFALLITALVLLVVIAALVGHLVHLVRDWLARMRGTAPSATSDRRSSH
jgi:fructose-specific phosphotransferase system IIC component